MFFYHLGIGQVFSYSVFEDNIQLRLSTDNNKNEEFIDSVLNEVDTCLIKTMAVGGEYVILPNNIYKFALLESLELSSLNEITINKEFSSFTKLTSLMVFARVRCINNSLVFNNIKVALFPNCALKKFPSAVCNWKSLRELSIQNGYFNSIPKELDLLKNLEILNLNSNSIKSLPMNIIHLKKLKVLAISHNKIKSIPEYFCQMKSLEEVYINLNLAKIPSCLQLKVKWQ
jgi:Leucine-rich repeat (LRR) protein